jgi:5'-3' exonuclease, N-terminal resolvase-like domain
VTKLILIDADPLAYRAVFSKEGDTIGGVCGKIDELFENIFDAIIERYGKDYRYIAFLTGPNNFRHEIAKDYKAQRPKEKPVLLNFARNYIMEEFNTILTEGEEADDAIAILATKHFPDAVIVSIDKDFKQVPGLLYNPTKDEWTEVSEEDGVLFKGVWKVGKAKAEKILEGATTKEEMWKRCLEAYEGDYDRAVMNGRLLWLRRYENQMWEPPKENVNE